MDTEPAIESTSAFLALPTELRLNIYSCLWGCKEREAKLVFTQCSTLTRSKLMAANPPWAPAGAGSALFPSALALMQTCKQVSAEAREFISSKTKFKISILNYSERDYRPERYHGFLRFARNIKIRIFCDAKREPQRARLFFKDLKAVLASLTSNDQLRSFEVDVSLRRVHSWRQDEMDQEVIERFTEVEEWLKTAGGDNLEAAWMLLSKLEELFAKQLKELEQS